MSQKRPTAETVRFEIFKKNHWHKGRQCKVGEIITIAKWKVKGFEKEGIGKLYLASDL